MSLSGLTWGDIYLCSSKRQAEIIIFEAHIYKELDKIIPSIWTEAQQYLKKNKTKNKNHKNNNLKHTRTNKVYCLFFGLFSGL